MSEAEISLDFAHLIRAWRMGSAGLSVLFCRDSTAPCEPAEPSKSEGRESTGARLRDDAGLDEPDAGGIGTILTSIKKREGAVVDVGCDRWQAASFIGSGVPDFPLVQAGIPERIAEVDGSPSDDVEV